MNLFRFGKKFLLGLFLSSIVYSAEPDVAALRKKSAKGDIKATVELAHLSLRSDAGVEYDPEFIFESFTKGAAAGNAQAHYGLAKCYVLEAGTKKDEKLAFKHAKISADKGDAQGVRYLGNCYLYGRGMDEPDTKKGVELLKKSIRMGNVMAEYTYAFYLTKNRKDRRSNDEGVEMIRELVKKKSADGMHLLGMLYHDGAAGLPRDRKLAMKHYRMAADLNHSGGLHQVGNMLHQDGKAEEAIGWLVKALNRGSKNSEWTLAKILRDDPELIDDPNQWVVYAERSAIRGNKYAQDAVGEHFYRHAPEKKKDWVKAKKFALMAAEQGQCHCWDWLSHMHAAGQHGLKQDVKLALKYCEKHFEHHHYSAATAGRILLQENQFHKKKALRIKGYAALLAANKRGAKISDEDIKWYANRGKISKEEIKEAKALAETGFPKPGDKLLE